MAEAVKLADYSEVYLDCLRKCLQSNPIETVFDLDERPTEFVIYKIDHKQILEVEEKMGPLIL